MSYTVSVAFSVLRSCCATSSLRSPGVRNFSAYLGRRYLSTSRLLTFKAQRESPESASPIPKRASEREKHPDLNVRSKPKEKSGSPYITLIDTNNEVSVVTLEAAQKLASHKSLRLVKESESTGDIKRETYRLVQAAEYFKKAQKEKLRSVGLKGEKVMAMKSHIHAHDLNPKLNQMKEWLKKSYQVRVAIDSLGDVGKAREVFAQIEQALKDLGCINQKQDTKAGIRFILKPSQHVDASEQDDI